MRVIDENTQQEIVNPDLSKGFTYEQHWASSEAYATIDNVAKFALYDSDYEDVLIYHEYTEDELREMVLQEQLKLEMIAKEEFINSLPEQLDDISSALCELADIGAESEVSIEDLMDAVTELAELVSQMIGD